VDLFEKDSTLSRPPPVHPRLHVGTSGWAYPDWVGPFYPTGTLPRDFLATYTRRFGAVEIDSTFYRIPTAKMVDAWNAATPEDFRFAPKVPQVITHEKCLEGCAAELTMFLDVVRRLGAKLGPLVFQFDAGFRVESLPILGAFLAGLPTDLRHTVEIRHRSWLRDDFFQLLEKYKVALVLADLYYMPKLDKVTTDFSYIRLLGKRSAAPDDFSRVRLDRERELNLWAERIRAYLDRGLQVFAFANNRFQGHGPASARALLTRLAGNPPTS
jgi:uncharacterized protein YecE (DUF72 family)